MKMEDTGTAYENSSIIFGLDLFYWDAIWDTCGNGRRLYSKDTNEIIDIEYQIERLIESAKEGGKTLILGTVPYDEGSKIFISAEITGVEGLWYPPTPSCVR